MHINRHITNTFVPPEPVRIDITEKELPLNRGGKRTIHATIINNSAKEIIVNRKDFKPEGDFTAYYRDFEETTIEKGAERAINIVLEHKLFSTIIADADVRLIQGYKVQGSGRPKLNPPKAKGTVKVSFTPSFWNMFLFCEIGVVVASISNQLVKTHDLFSVLSYAFMVVIIINAIAGAVAVISYRWRSKPKSLKIQDSTTWFFLGILAALAANTGLKDGLKGVIPTNLLG